MGVVGDRMGSVDGEISDLICPELDKCSSDIAIKYKIIILIAASDASF